MVTILSIIWIVFFVMFSHERPKGFAPYLIGALMTFIIGLELLKHSDIIIMNDSYHIMDDNFCGNDNCKRMIDDYKKMNK